MTLVIEKVGLNPKIFGLHSLRSGGMIVAVNNAVKWQGQGRLRERRFKDALKSWSPINKNQNNSGNIKVNLGTVYIFKSLWNFAFKY